LGVNTYARFIKVIWLLVGMAIFVSAIAIHQGFQPPQCIEMMPDAPDAVEEGEPDGRECETAWGCTKDSPKPEADYTCERIGLLRTFSIVRRVRWRGQLNDPNELAVFLGMVIPLLLALSAIKKKTTVTIFALATIGIYFFCVILTQSRGGQLTIGAVLGIYFVLRFGMKGLIAGAAMAAPVALLGGRSDAMAESSSEERASILYEGVDAFISHPFGGVGVDQFRDYTSVNLTAHNSYLLAATELGLFGMLCWMTMFWTAVKIPFAIMWRKESPEELKPLATGLIVSFIGMSIGIFFLSFNYKQLLFIWFGLSGALYRIAKDNDPGYDVKVTRKDLVYIFIADLVIMGLIFLYTRLHSR
jgi:hypothetical protein